MAKKVQEKKSVSSKLMTGKDELGQRIEERIVEGKVLLDFPVKVIANKVDTFGNSYGEYDKTEQSNFLLAYDKWKRFNIELLRRSFDDPNNEYIQEYEDSVRSSIWSDWVRESKYDVRRQITVLESLIERLPLITSAVETNEIAGATKKKLSNKIFIVHGHNSEVKQIVARTISQLKLEPIILHEQAEQGRTIIEKFEKNSSEVNFAIVILTADDEGKSLREDNYKFRARQNVVFEMGYFIGKLGRENVFLLLENDVDKPGDLDGIVYVPIDSSEGWKIKLVKELRLAGYRVTADNLY